MNLAAEIDAVARETIDWNERPTQEVTPLLAEFGIGRRSTQRNRLGMS
jgi:hypothetical protein